MSDNFQFRALYFVVVYSSALQAAFDLCILQHVDLLASNTRASDAVAPALDYVCNFSVVFTMHSMTLLGGRSVQN